MLCFEIAAVWLRFWKCKWVSIWKCESALILYFLHIPADVTHGARPCNWSQTWFANTRYNIQGNEAYLHLYLKGSKLILTSLSHRSAKTSDLRQANCHYS